MKETNILVVDDEKEIADLLEIYLISDGFQVKKAYSAAEGLKMLEEQSIDLVLLDVMMPDMDNIPIIMVSAKTQELDKIVGLTNGADDYVSKPFNPLELMARVKSQLRRYRELNPSRPQENQDVIRLKNLEINKVTHGENVKLTPIEFDILYLLASNPGRVFSTDEIFERVWHEKFYEANNTVMVHIRRLRGKMKDDTREEKIITTVWGVGYKIEA